MPAIVSAPHRPAVTLAHRPSRSGGRAAQQLPGHVHRLAPHLVDARRRRRRHPVRSRAARRRAGPDRFISSGAVSRALSESDTALITCTPSSPTEAETHHERPVLVLVAELVHHARVRLLVEPLVARRPDRARRRSPAGPPGPPSPPPPCASFSFSAWISRSFAFSASRSFAYSSTSSRRSVLADCSSSSRMPWSCLGARERRLAGERLDAARARGDALLAGQQEQADLAGVVDVRAAAELLREARGSRSRARARRTCRRRTRARRRRAPPRGP